MKSLVGRWLSELRATLPIKVSCRFAICFSMLGISKNLFLDVSFVMRCYLTLSILIPSMRHMLRCSNTSSFSRKGLWSTHISHPHSSRLMVMARKMIYFLLLSALLYFHNLARAPIDTFPDSSVYPTVFYPHLRTIFWSSSEDKSATFMVHSLRSLRRH